MHFIVVASLFGALVQHAMFDKGGSPLILPVSQSVLGAAIGRWAMDDASNCSVPSKAYTLSTAGGKIVWVSDIGNTDVEAVIDVSDVDFRTITITSSRVSGRSEPTGMTWSYARIGPQYMKVTRGGRDTFLLARCFE